MSLESTMQNGNSLPVQVPVQLRRLFPDAQFLGTEDIRVTSATADSRECRPGTLFAAIPGEKLDGHEFAAEAAARGASALLVERPQRDLALPQCVVPNVRRAFAELCSRLWQSPSLRLKTVGVTGTNGKTTTTWLIQAILQSAACQTGVLGTIHYDDGIHTEKSRLTTPDSASLSSWLARMVHCGTTHAAMEVSSHALVQDRIDGTLLDVAILTNVTQDHFDFHHNYATYLQAKQRIFRHLKPGGLAVFNADDPGSMSCRESSRDQRQVTFGLEKPADITAKIFDESLSGTLFDLRLPTGEISVRIPLLGRHNVSNCLAAAAAAWHFGLSPKQIGAGLASLRAVPGRMESVEWGQAFSVFVDYAHTDDALRRCLQSLRALTPGRVIVVYGAGGDRDRAKRPLLTQAAALADLAILTSDNPRTEDPAQIIADCLTGCVAGRPRPDVISDREAAIRSAIDFARPGDSVLIAGKGHETEQIIGCERHHFDDREVVRAALTSFVPRNHFQSRQKSASHS
jgi:UDP-N-acetylmuramoyl-L-alanyl-D-glutamate--2,6-diaminopimelate ligase